MQKLDNPNGEVVVIGSTNWDICMYLPSLPLPGETVADGTLKTVVGGKGANQAIASHLAGSRCHFVSCLGDDAAATTILRTFSQLGLDTHRLRQLPGQSTGTACIFVDASGENCIGVTPGANARFDAELVALSQDVIASSDVLLMQLEIPVASVELAVRLAKQNGTRVVLNPAPAKFLSDSALGCVDVLTPNRLELAELSGIDVPDNEAVKRASVKLLSRGVSAVLTTLGRDGVVLVLQRDGLVVLSSFPAFTVDAVDTTAAGDVFSGYLAAELSRVENRGVALQHLNWDQIISVSSAAAAISVTREGALPSVPRRKDVVAMLEAGAAT